MREKTIVRQFLAKSYTVSRARVFLNVVATAWVGRLVKFDGFVAVLEAAQRVECGLVEGSGDVIGHETVTITPEMVGQKIARFISIEFKQPGGRIRPKQEIWMSSVNKAGGRACIVDNVAAALEFLEAN